MNDQDILGALRLLAEQEAGTSIPPTGILFLRCQAQARGLIELPPRSERINAIRAHYLALEGSFAHYIALEGSSCD